MLRDPFAYGCSSHLDASHFWDLPLTLSWRTGGRVTCFGETSHGSFWRSSLLAGTQRGLALSKRHMCTTAAAVSLLASRCRSCGSRRAASAGCGTEPCMDELLLHGRAAVVSGPLPSWTAAYGPCPPSMPFGSVGVLSTLAHLGPSSGMLRRTRRCLKCAWRGGGLSVDVVAIAVI